MFCPTHYMKYNSVPGSSKQQTGSLCVCLPADKCAAYTVTWTPGRNVNWTRFWFKALSRTSESCGDTEGDRIWNNIVLFSRKNKMELLSKVIAKIIKPQSHLSLVLTCHLLTLFWQFRANTFVVLNNLGTHSSNFLNARLKNNWDQMSLALESISEGVLV